MTKGKAIFLVAAAFCLVILDIAAGLFRVDRGLLDIWASLFHLLAFSLFAVILYKHIRRKGAPAPSFRGAVITVSLLFAAIFSNVATNLTQAWLVGETYIKTDMRGEEYESEHGRPEAAFGQKLNESQSEALFLLQRVTHLSLDVAREEVLYRFILLGTLLLFISPAWAVGISSLLFALTHAVLPWIITQELIPTLSPVLPAFFMGISFGAAFLWCGLPAALVVHFGMNLASAFASDHTYIADSLMFGSAFVTLVILPITLWFSRKRDFLTTDIQSH